MAYDRLIHMTDDPGCKETLAYLTTREVSHQKMFMLALESLGGDAMEGSVQPVAEELSVYYNLSRDGQGDAGVGLDERGAWNEDGEWTYVEKPEDQLKAKVQGPGKPVRQKA